MKILKLVPIIVFGLLICCDDNQDDSPQPSSPNLIIKLKFDPTQERLGNTGQPASVGAGNAAQSPSINKMSANYIEFAPTTTTALGADEIIFEGDETSAGGDQAINFQNVVFAGDNETFLSIPLSDISAGNYEWVRASLAYQEGDINLLVNGQELSGTLASFVGYNSYISSFDLNGSTIDVNDNKAEGFWAFEALGFTTQGQAPEDSTTAPNPLFNSSPIPQGS